MCAFMSQLFPSKKVVFDEKLYLFSYLFFLRLSNWYETVSIDVAGGKQHNIFQSSTVPLLLFQFLTNFFIN